MVPVESSGDTKVFTQDDVNRFMAEDRRKMGVKHEAKQVELETAYKDALANQNISGEARERLEGQLEDLQKTFLSKEQQLEQDKTQLEQKYTEEVSGLRDKAEIWETRYMRGLVDRELQDAAIKNDSFSSEQIMSLLNPMTKVVEVLDPEGKGTGEFHPMVDLQDIDQKTGEPIITRRTPMDAVKRMRELPQKFGNLFKSNVVSGVGEGSATGSGLSGTGMVDASKMSTAQYMEMRKKNPGALGLGR